MNKGKKPSQTTNLKQVDAEKVKDQDDVQRLILVLAPESESEKIPGKPVHHKESNKRVFIIGKKGNQTHDT